MSELLMNDVAFTCFDAPIKCVQSARMTDSYLTIFFEEVRGRKDEDALP
jgi:hypothetical protein